MKNFALKYSLIAVNLLLYTLAPVDSLELGVSMAVDTELKETVELSVFDQNLDLLSISKLYTRDSPLDTGALSCRIGDLGFGNVRPSGEFVFWDRGSQSLGAIEDQGTAGADRTRLFDPRRLSSPDIVTVAFSPLMFDSVFMLEKDYVITALGLVPLRSDEVFGGLWYVNQTRLDQQSSLSETWLLDFSNLKPREIEAIAASLSFTSLGLRMGAMLEFYGMYSSRAFYLTFAKSLGAGAEYLSLSASIACNDPGFIGITGTWIDELSNVRASLVKGVFQYLRVGLDFGYGDSYIEDHLSQKFIRYQIFLGDKTLELRASDKIDLGTMTDHFEAAIYWRLELLEVSADLVFGETYVISPNLSLTFDQCDVSLQAKIKKDTITAGLKIDLFKALHIKASFDKDYAKDLVTWYGSIELELKS